MRHRGIAPILILYLRALNADLWIDIAYVLERLGMPTMTRRPDVTSRSDRTIGSIEDTSKNIGEKMRDIHIFLIDHSN